MKAYLLWILLLLLTFSVGVRANTIGSIFLTGHDPDFHALAGGNNAPGAQGINRAAISFIMDPQFNPFVASGATKFLFVESKISPPGGHVVGEQGIVASGYTLGTNFDSVDASGLSSALGKLGTIYGGIVIASDFGGDLTQAELSILDSNSAEIINFLNQGGGLYAMAETVPPEGLATGPLFGFLPFVVSSTPLDQFESGNAITPFGASLGLTNSDINGNFSHNVFDGTFGLKIVDQDPRGEILSLAGRGTVSSGGVTATPEISTLLMLLGGLALIASVYYCSRFQRTV